MRVVDGCGCKDIFRSPKLIAERWRTLCAGFDPFGSDARFQELLAPDFADGHSNLGTALAKMGRFDEAIEEIEEMQTAIKLAPSSVEYQFNLGFIFKLRTDYTRAASAFEKSVQPESKNSQPIAELADGYDKSGRSAQAVKAAQQALELAIRKHDKQLERQLRAQLEGYQRNAAKAQPQ